MYKNQIKEFVHVFVWGDSQAATKVAVQHLHFLDQFELFLVLVMSQLAFGKGIFISDWQKDFFHLWFGFLKGFAERDHDQEAGCQT